MNIIALVASLFSIILSGISIHMVLSLYSDVYSKIDDQYKDELIKNIMDDMRKNIKEMEKHISELERKKNV